MTPLDLCSSVALLFLIPQTAAPPLVADEATIAELRRLREEAADLRRRLTNAERLVCAYV